MTTSELELLIQKMFAPPSYSMLYEVRDGTGFATAGRQCDMMAFGTWPSRGLEILGFELKISRSDWLREMKAPEKAEAFFGYCDRWYLAAPEGVVKGEELPVGWGLLEAKVSKDGSWKLRSTVPATPKPANKIDRLFLMSIIRNVCKNYVPARKVQELAEQRIKLEIERAIQDTKYSNQRESRELEAIKARVKKFEEASGVKIDEWGDMERIGECVKIVRQYGARALQEQMGYAVCRLRECADAMEKCIEGQSRASDTSELLEVQK